MRAMIIGFSTPALAWLPTLAVADGDGALTGAAGGAVAGAVVGRRSHRRSGLWAWSGGRSPAPRRRPVRHPNNDDDKQQYRRERHETNDELSRLSRIPRQPGS
jgi:hypothetical protein